MEFFMCFSILLYVWINNLNHVVCYGTLIITSKTKVESSSIYSQGLYSGDANKTIDGNTAQDYKNCMHTALSQSEAWLKIDLGSVFNVKSIKIWYRNDRGVGTTKRLRGFSILVSNNSDFDVNDTCYQDPGNIHLETVLEVNCSRSAQYVKIYTNKNNDGGVILEICEVKIYGCGHCAKNAVCDQDNGSCPGGHCEPGWKHANDLRCDQECENGTFGLYCQSNCSDKCAKGQSCNKANGFCQGGCENGWTIHNCTENELVVSGYTRTKSSSVYHYNGYIGYADKTVDGNIDQKQYSNCMHTDIGQEKAWLRVDLRILSIISSVKLWYRNDHTIPNFNTRRMKGFNIRLTNTTRKNQQKICYEDDGKSNPPTIIKAKCEGVAQYVWIYTNISFKDGAILEICEVQVYGCPYQDSDGKCISCDGCRKDCDCENFDCRKAGYRPQNCSSSLKCTNGTYGHGCKSTCGHCANNTACDHVHGSCPNGKCEPGWESTQDWKCDKECKNGTYGHDCKGNCGHCANNIVCDHIDGSCPNRKCVPGWKSTAGGKCDKECKNGTYGHDCKGNCGHCANNTVCDHIDGSCPNRKCAPGWKSTQDTKCDKECKNGTYGHGCSSTCGHCANNTACNHVTGSCPNSKCAPGWENTEGGKCEKECRNGTYGHNCKENCGHCANNTVCDHIDGSCPNRKCAPGWESTQDTKCDKECKNGTYGHGCSSTCGHCANENACDHVTGSCPNRKCAPGWESTEGEKCEKACKPGLYGMDCSRSCGHCQNNSTCNHVTGSCPTGYCEPGWKHTKEKRCDQECENGTFGYYCRGKCSRHCADGFPCDKVDGICREGCADGWINPHCNESCTEGLYGRNCSLKCGHCAENKYCNHVNGSCPSGSCEPGWKHTEESRCNQACDNGTFGYHCIHTCSGNCAGGSTCTKADGTCPRGCTDGWINERCNETCSKKFYGKGCKENCGHCGGAESCHHIDGFCPGLCEPGYYGKKCNTECYNGTFGLRCNFTCSEGCVSVCNKINGSCDHCHYGYIGEFCNITVAEVQAQESTAAAAGVGAFLLILVIIVIVLAVVLAKKARRKKEGDIDLQERKGTSNNVFQENNIDDNTNKTENAVPIEGTDDIEYIVTDNGQMKTLIKIADLGKIIKMFSMEENKKFTEEFKGIPYGEQQHIPCSVAKLQQNMPKNRYKTTFPYDHSRVVLNVSPDNDYINANYIKDVEGKRRYIATQGPRKNTVQDFWAMIWQENIRVIVMVTKLTEGSTIKCEQYWPGQGEQMTSGQFCLQLMSQKDYANYTQRDINITNKKTKAVKTVNQVQFTSWPDHGTPSPIELLVFYRHVMRLTRMYPECPLVVHCSAGIGRTGTFIALDALYKHGQKEGKIDIVEYVKIMREDRMNMIQNAGQYVFLYKALYEIFKTSGRLLNKEEFIKEVTSQLMSNKAANASQFKKEFNELLSIKPVLDENETKDARQNIDLNMTKTVLPADSIRVLLTSYARGRGNYYNAVPISSYTLRDGLIAAQYPVEGAAVDLVRLLIDQECTILVSINQLSDIATSAKWMTTSAEKSVISPYKTMLGTGRSLSNKLKMTVVKMKHDKDSEWHTVKVLEILNWKINEKLPAEEDVLIELMNKVQEIIKDPDTKIIVLSKDGATGCGIFCAVYNAIQQLQQDNEVDMFTIVRQLQMRRPEMISSMSEYQCCCQVVANFFSAHKDDIYENAQGQQEVTKMEENIYANTSS